jgi:hypothetical protein
MGLANTFVAVTYYFACGLIFCFDTTVRFLFLFINTSIIIIIILDFTSFRSKEF